MATGTSIITGALRVIGQVRRAGQGASPSEIAEGLTQLNAMLGEWSAEQFALYQLVVESITLTGAASYTFGPGATLDSARPLRIMSAETAATSGASQQAKLATADDWAQIWDSTQTGTFAEMVYSDGGFPVVTLRVWPKPASGSLNLTTLKALATIAAAGDTVTLPPGYEEALEYNLAVKLGPRFGLPVPPEVAAVAERGRRAIAATNAQLLPAPPVVPSLAAAAQAAQGGQL